jgi:protein-L-isoaspartate(D-aspartate) O-methyltransferase
MDIALQRKNMVESQVRPSDVTDRRIIRAMLDIPRERFVPERSRAIAYMDEALVLGSGRTLMAPRLVARMIQALDLGDADTVLEIGAATGYTAAILARIAQRVVALEQVPTLADAAKAALAATGADNVSVVTGDLTAGRGADAPFDAILVSGAVDELPDTILDQLKDGGRLVTVVASGPLGRVVQWRRFGGTFDQRVLFEAGAAPLPGFQRKAEFVL